MVSAEVKRMYEAKGIPKLYKMYEKSFNLVDEWADKTINGDLLDEINLHFAMQQLSGIYAKLNSVAGAFEALTIEYENDYILKEEKTFNKIRIQDKDHCKAFARNKVSDLRRYTADFSRYCISAQTMIVTCQSRLKRMSVEGAVKGIKFIGDTSNIPKDETWNG